MAGKRIRGLDTSTIALDADYVAIDNSTFTDAKKVTKANFLSEDRADIALRELASHKTTVLSVSNDVLYPTVKAVNDGLDLKLDKDFTALTDEPTLLGTDIVPINIADSTLKKTLLSTIATWIGETFAYALTTTAQTIKGAINELVTTVGTKIAKTTNITALNETGIADGEIAVFNLTNKDIRTSDKTIVTTLGADDTTVPTSKAVKDVTDAKIAKTTNITSLNETGIADGEIAIFNLTNKDIRTSDKTIVTMLGTDDTTVPTSKAMVDALSLKIDKLDFPIFGVKFTKASSSPAGTRTRSAVGLTATSGVGVAGASGFDTYNVFKLRTCNRVGGIVTAYYGEPGFDAVDKDTFVEIPKAYYRVWDDGTYLNYEISELPFTGASLHPVFKHNAAVQNKIYLASYKSSYNGSSKHESKSGKFPDVIISRPTSRTRSIARGAYACVQDVQVRDWLNILVMVEFATRDSQSAIGRGYCDMPYSATHVSILNESAVNRIVIANAFAALFVVGQEISIGTSLGANGVAADRTVSSIDVYDASNKSIVFGGAAVNIAIGNIVWTSRQKTGKTDSIGQGTGRATGTDGKTSIRYRGIEDPFGNVYEWVDNLNINSNQGYSDVQGRITTYGDADVGTLYSAFSAVFPNSNNYMATPLIDTVTGLSCLPATVGGASTQYFCDYYYQNTGLRASLVGGSWLNGSLAGLWSWYLVNGSSGTDFNIGSRLLEIPS